MFVHRNSLQIIYLWIVALIINFAAPLQSPDSKYSGKNTVDQDKKLEPPTAWQNNLLNRILI